MTAHPEIGVSMTAAPATLSELFGGRRRFVIPWFQRAYAWEPQHAGQLFADILARAETNHTRKRYHLGTVRLARNQPDLEGCETLSIVDGQQRIVTLTILFCVLRDLDIAQDMNERLVRLVASAAPGEDGAPFRLSPQRSLEQLLATLVQEPQATLRPVDNGNSPFSVSERNAIEIRELFVARLSAEGWTPHRRAAFARYLLEACQVTCEIWHDEQEAWHFYQIDEDTHLPIDATARVKASLIEVFPPEEREEANLVWLQIESMLGPAELFALLGHVRTLRQRRRSEAPLELDLARAFHLDRGGLAFLRDDVLVQAYRLKALQRGMIGGQSAPASIRRAITHLNWINPTVWVPAALHWIEQRGAHDPQTELFFQRLERVVWCLRIAGTDPPTKQNRLIRLLNEIDAGISVDAMVELSVPDKAIEAAVKNLRSANFRDKHYAVTILRRISVACGDDWHLDTHTYATIEHVLPQNPARTGWFARHLQRKHKAHCNMLGNLTLLSEADNQEAGRQVWELKRPILARSTYAISRHASEELEWNYSVIAHRTGELIKILLREWDLDLPR